MKLGMVCRLSGIVPTRKLLARLISVNFELLALAKPAKVPTSPFPIQHHSSSFVVTNIYYHCQDHLKAREHAYRKRGTGVALYWTKYNSELCQSWYSSGSLLTEIEQNTTNAHQKACHNMPSRAQRTFDEPPQGRGNVLRT
jgi:hypothetical protein